MFSSPFVVPKIWSSPKFFKLIPRREIESRLDTWRVFNCGQLDNTALMSSTDNPKCDPNSRFKNISLDNFSEPRIYFFHSFDTRVQTFFCFKVQVTPYFNQHFFREWGQQTRHVSDNGNLLNFFFVLETWIFENLCSKLFTSRFHEFWRCCYFSAQFLNKNDRNW